MTHTLPASPDTSAWSPSLETSLEVEPLGPRFGAIIHEVDLTEVDDHQLRAIRQTLLTHKVVFFPDQVLDDAAHVAFASRLGDLTVGHPIAQSDSDHEEIFSIDSSDSRFNASDVWHTDVTFMERPPAISILRAVELPPTGGDTSWADSELAYESLSAPVRHLVDQLTAVHDGWRSWGAYLRSRSGVGNTWDGDVVTELNPVEHPVVRIHPETGRRGLYVNPGFTSHIAGVSEAESRGILDLLYAHLTRPENTIRHRWAPGDVGIWDNRATAHYANLDYTDRRFMSRVTIKGDRPFGPSTVVS